MCITHVIAKINTNIINISIVPDFTLKCCFAWFFYPLLVSFCLQITHRKVRNFSKGVNKLVGKVWINLLSHAVSRLHNQHNY